MSNKTDIESYYNRREKRLDEKRRENLKVIAEYRARRQARLDARQEREDANMRRIYGIAKGMGIDIEGMEPKEVIEAIKKNGGKAYGKGSDKQFKEQNKASTGDIKYNKTFKTPSGKPFPKIKDGAVWDSDTLKEVNRLAKGRTKQMDAVMDKITSDDILYQKDSNGREIASIPGLSQMFNNRVVGKSQKVNEIYKNKISHGKDITNDMLDVGKKNGVILLGLENCYKGGDSTARKIDKKKNHAERDGKKVTDESVAKSLYDVVRYTMKVDQKNAVKSAVNIEKDFENKGYEVVQRDNKYLKETARGSGKYEYDNDAQYKAIHLTLASPTKELIEVQIHSNDTIKVKNKNHKLYEEQRKLPEESSRAKELGEKMKQNWSAVKDPDGIREYMTFDKREEWKEKNGYI